MNKYKKLYENMCNNPYSLQLPYEEALALLKDPDVPQEVKDNIIDIRDKLPKQSNENSLKYLQYKNEQTELQHKFNELGGFVFSVYQKLGIMFDDSILSQEDKSKILLLATYMGYDNRLKFKNSKMVLKSHLPILLRLSDRSVRSFTNKIVDLGILSIKDDGLYLNENLFIKGSTDKSNQINDEDFGYTRLFINSYQYMYDNIPKTKLKYLGILYNLLGYVNFYHNVIVKDNPEEKDIDKINPMTFKEILAVCGYKDDMTSKSENKLKNSLLSIKLENGLPLFAITDSNNGSKMFINPHVVYASSNINTWTSTLEIIFKCGRKE